MAGAIVCPEYRDLPPVRFHDLRHTHVSLLIAANVNVKAIQVRMGHTSITTTMNTYGHLLPSAFEGVAEKLDVLVQTKAKREAAQAGITASVNARIPSPA